MRTKAGRYVIGVDTETHLITPGLATPPMVCMTLSAKGEAANELGMYLAPYANTPRALVFDDGDRIDALLSAEAARALWPALIADDNVHLVGHHVFYDLGVLAHETCDVVAIFDAIDGGPEGERRGPRISDTLLRQTLAAIAHGTDGAMVDGRPIGPFHLSDLVDKHFGVDIGEDKRSIPKSHRGDVWAWVVKTQTCPDCAGSGRATGGECNPWLGLGHPRRAGRDCTTCEGFGLVGPWRLRYCQLDGVPLGEWPADAVEYAIMDSRWALDVFEAQAAVQPPYGAPGPIVDADTGLLVNEWQQTEAGWALHLMSLWAPRTGEDATRQTIEAWQAAADRCHEIGTALGFVRANGSENRAEMTRLIREDFERRGLDVPRNPPTSNNLAKARAMREEVQLLEEQGALKPGKMNAAWKRAYKAATVALGKTAPAEMIASHARGVYLAEARELELGNIKYDSDTLTSCKGPKLREYAEHTTDRDNLTKYAYILERGTHYPVTSRPTTLVATGRTAWSNPPYQQPPGRGGFREAHEARPGWLYGHGDYDTIELVSQAQNLLDLGFGSDLADRINAGIDLHTDYAADELGITYDEAKRRVKAGDPEAIAARNRGKVLNFGCWGRMGGAALVNAYGVEVFGCTEFDEAVVVAKRLRQRWLAKNPQAQPYFDWCRSELDVGGGTTVAKQLMSGRLRMVDKLTTLCNTYFQGRTADGAKNGIYQVSRETYTGWPRDVVLAGVDGPGPSPLLGGRQWLLLHDEVIAEFERDRAEAGVRRMCEVLTTAMQELVPDVKVNIDPVLARRWSKKADTVQTQAGQLVPWEPWKDGRWSPWAGPRKGWVAQTLDDGTVAVIDENRGLCGSWTHPDPVVARHRAECFVLGENPMV